MNGVLAGAGVGLVLALIFLFRGWRRFVAPSKAEAVARVDAQLSGNPISALSDTQTIGAGDASSEAVWSAHIARMQAKTREAKPVVPDLRISQADPFGLRYAALLFLLVGILFGSGNRGPLVLEAAPVTNSAGIVAGPSWEGWIEPPRYTGLPTLYLADLTSDRIQIPDGSRITVRFYGDAGALSLSETVSGQAANNNTTDMQQQFTVEQTGELVIHGKEDRTWEIVLLQDSGPNVELTGAVMADGVGEMTQPFRAIDDYGVAGGTATFTLDLSRVERSHGLQIDPDPIAPIVVDLPVPITGDRSDFDEALVEDFSEYLLANMPVQVVFEVTDANGQTGQTPVSEMVLPGRRFFQPVAKAVVELRRDLMWSKQNAARVARLLRAVSYQPEGLFSNPAHAAIFRDVIESLEAKYEDGDLTDAEQQAVVKTLWELALELEDGSLADARARLQRAQDQLAEAMRNGASPEEIQRLMDDLRDATDDYMQMLADQMDQSNDGTDQPDSQAESFEFTQDELNALMDRIQELMEEGRMAEAAELMEQLNQLMENMQMTQGGGQGGPQTPGQQSMEDLGNTLRDQQQLSDDAFRDLQDQFNGDQGQGQESDGEGDGQSLSERQQALRDLLEEQRGNLPSLSGEAAEAARRALERAEGAMDRAEEALRNGDLAEAIDRQADAMDALREGLRELGQAITQAERDQNGQDGQTDTQAGQALPRQSDPLGRQLGTSGQSDTDQNLLQDEEVYRRADDLMDEIRRRSAELDRPEEELDYLRRLLNRF